MSMPVWITKEVLEEVVRKEFQDQDCKIFWNKFGELMIQPVKNREEDPWIFRIHWGEAWQFQGCGWFYDCDYGQYDKAGPLEDPEPNLMVFLNQLKITIPSIVEENP